MKHLILYIQYSTIFLFLFSFFLFLFFHPIKVSLLPIPSTYSSIPSSFCFIFHFFLLPIVLVPLLPCLLLYFCFFTPPVPASSFFPSSSFSSSLLLFLLYSPPCLFFLLNHNGAAGISVIPGLLRIEIILVCVWCLLFLLMMHLLSLKAHVHVNELCSFRQCCSLLSSSCCLCLISSCSPTYWRFPERGKARLRVTNVL